MNINRLNELKDESMLQAKQIPLMQWYINEYIRRQKKYLENCTVKEARAFLLSEENRIRKKNMKSCSCYGLWIKKGDVVFADFGEAYMCEVGYQHLAIVLNISGGKALIVPMSSNMNTVMNAYDEITNPQGNRQLMRIKDCPYLEKESVLFLNDIKYISTARIIDVKGNIDVNSVLFRNINRRINQCLINTE